MKKIILLPMFLLATMMVNAQPSKEYPLKKRIKEYIEANKSNCSFIEVMEDMFQALAEDEKTKPEVRDYISKIKYLVFVECPSPNEQFFTNFTDISKLPEFKVLMQAKEDNEEFAFYKKRASGRQGDKTESLNEYLLVHSQGISYIITALNIKTINELSEIMEVAGSIQ